MALPSSFFAHEDVRHRYSRTVNDFHSARTKSRQLILTYFRIVDGKVGIIVVLNHYLILQIRIPYKET